MTNKKTEEELREFILENEEKILEILQSRKSKAESKFSEEMEKSKALTKGVLEAFMNKEVQGHFIRMGIEMMMGVGALIKALPLPEEFSPLVDAVTEQNDALEGMVKKNPGKTKKKKSDVEKIEVK